MQDDYLWKTSVTRGNEKGDMREWFALWKGVRGFFGRKFLLSGVQEYMCTRNCVFG